MYNKIIKFSKNLISGITLKDEILEFSHVLKKEKEVAEFNQKSKKVLESYLDSEKKPNVVIAEISISSVIKIIGILIGFFLLWGFVAKTSEILTSLFFSIFLASVLYPMVKFFEQKKIPKIAAILLSFFSVFLFLGLLISSVLPAVIEQSITFGNWLLEYTKLIYNGDFSSLPNFIAKFGPWLQEKLHIIDAYLKGLSENTQAQSGLFQFITENISKFKPWQEGIINTVSFVFSSLFSFVLIIILTFFLLLERKEIYNYVLDFFSPKLKEYINLKSTQMQEKVSGWIHGQMLLFIFVGGLTWLFFAALGIEYAVTIGFIAGVAEFLPYFGPIVTFLIGMPLALAESWEAAFAVLIFLGVMQFIEGNILVPLIMEKSVGVTGFVTILSLLVGFKLLGVAGAIIAIPVIAIVGIFVDDIKNLKK
ncbi:TPA: AI-2E family transporter [Candidatus Gracilibacteria bacterium]|nr:AI-2E family transporter [Candidatus Gracilibacteria bacterium]